MYEYPHPLSSKALKEYLLSRIKPDDKDSLKAVHILAERAEGLENIHKEFVSIRKRFDDVVKKT